MASNRHNRAHSNASRMAEFLSHFYLTKLSSRSLSWFLISSCTHARIHFCSFSSSFGAIFIEWECPGIGQYPFSYDCMNVRKRSKFILHQCIYGHPRQHWEMNIKMATKTIPISSWFAMSFVLAETKSVELNELYPIFWHFSHKRLLCLSLFALIFGLSQKKK